MRVCVVVVESVLSGSRVCGLRKRSLFFKNGPCFDNIVALAWSVLFFKEKNDNCINGSHNTDSNQESQTHVKMSFEKKLLDLRDQRQLIQSADFTLRRSWVNMIRSMRAIGAR